MPSDSLRTESITALGGRRERIEEAQRLRTQGLSLVEIGQRLGVVHSTVSKWLNPERAREQVRADNARRHERKKEWARLHDRGVCEDCGAPTKVGAVREGTRRCRSCDNARRRQEWLEKVRVIEAMWAEGKTIAEIAAVFDTSANSMGVQINRIRRTGVADLPFRHHRREAA